MEGLTPLVQDELYRIGREILRNAFRHARARQIEVELRYEDRMFRLRIRDDGTGIDPEVLNPGGTRALGLATCPRTSDFWSETGAGTEVQLMVPAAVAYGKPRETRA